MYMCMYMYDTCVCMCMNTLYLYQVLRTHVHDCLGETIGSMSCVCVCKCRCMNTYVHIQDRHVETIGAISMGSCSDHASSASKVCVCACSLSLSLSLSLSHPMFAYVCLSLSLSLSLIQGLPIAYTHLGRKFIQMYTSRVNTYICIHIYAYIYMHMTTMSNGACARAQTSGAEVDSSPDGRRQFNLCDDRLSGSLPPSFPSSHSLYLPLVAFTKDRSRYATWHNPHTACKIARKLTIN